eukprot:gene19368-26016_t
MEVTSARKPKSGTRKLPCYRDRFSLSGSVSGSSLPTGVHRGLTALRTMTTMPQKTLDFIPNVSRDVSSDSTHVKGPWGSRRATYMDYAASGRMLKSGDESMQSQVHPCYANTHTDTTGGGSVVYVDQKQHQYDKSPATCKEAGAPDILADIRCGIACALWKDARSNAEVHCKEQSLNKTIVQGLMKTPRVIVLGSGRRAFLDYKTRLGVISFVISAKLLDSKEVLLHHHFVARLLNDLYGLQTLTSTGPADLKSPSSQVTHDKKSQFPTPLSSAPTSNDGCSIPVDVGNFPLEKPSFSEAAPTMIQEITEESNFSIKIGWTRVSVKYVTRMEDVRFFLSAVPQVAEHGWKLLPFYMLDPSSGQWHLREDLPLPSALVKKEAAKAEQKKVKTSGKKDGAAKKALVPGCFGALFARGSAAERMIRAAPQEAVKSYATKSKFHTLFCLNYLKAS